MYRKHTKISFLKYMNSQGHNVYFLTVYDKFFPIGNYYENAICDGEDIYQKMSTYK